MSFTNEELARLRADTPLVRSGRAHLNHAGASPPPDPVVEAVREYLEYEAEHGGYESAAARGLEIQQVYRDVAELVGGRSQQIALVENATVAFAQALAAFDFDPGDVILTTRNDYVSNQLMFLVLAKRRGVHVVHAEDLPEGGVDPDSLRRLVERHRPRLVSVTWIPTNSGLVQPVDEVGQICRELDVPFLVDACQAVGQLPIDVETLGCDFLAATGRKFLRGPRGTGFLWVSDRILEAGLHPTTLDLRGGDWTDPDSYELFPDARRFENWEFNYALVLGLGRAARYALDVGLERIAERSAELARRAREVASEAGLRVLDHGARLGAIVALGLPEGIGDAQTAVEALRERAIHTSAVTRSSAVFELDRLGVAEAVRVSPHYLNLEDEVDRTVEALASLGSR